MQSSIVHKLLSLLTTISEAQTPLTFSEIVERTGLNKSTIHRLLSIGVEERVLRFDGHKKVYLLGPRLFDLVRNADKGYDIQAIALDEMVQLSQRYDVNVTLGVPSGAEVAYLRVLEGRHSLGGTARPGMREPVHCSASGKALLAFHPAPLLASIMDGYAFTRFTDRTVTNLAAFETELEYVRKHGFGRNDREEYDHFVGISAPVFNYLREPVAVLNLWSVYPTHSIDDLTAWGSDLRAAADRVTAMIGGVPVE